jgi:CCR4-NOT transcriptional regulation complex NOT5 subunit
MFIYELENVEIGCNFFRIEANINNSSIEFKFFQTPLETILKTLDLNGIDINDEEIKENIKDYEF